MKNMLFLAVFAGPAMASVIAGFEFRLPPAFTENQRAKSDETQILGVATPGDGYLNLFVRPLREPFDPEETFFNGVRVLSLPKRESLGDFDWWTAETLRRYPQRGHTVAVYTSVFYTEENGSILYGFSRHRLRHEARANARAVLASIQTNRRSLTGPEYTGKKYYLGWGAAMNGDPSMMHNEVKYDVNHTHNIFTKEIGGSYLGTALIGPSVVTRTAILKNWKQIKDAMTDKDMFVQYSSGHGSSSGLAVGVTYNEIRDNALSLAAQEIIVFTMACYSGNLVESFNAKKSVWENWQSQGRTLMVMASSKKSETSSTGPGQDPDETGPYGSAGSAFGHALWKALIGYADGFVDGVKDGYLSLGEIEKYTIRRTYEVGGHTPVSTGVYNTGLIMNKVPPKAWVDAWDWSAQISDGEVMRQLEILDREMRVQ